MRDASSTVAKPAERTCKSSLCRRCRALLHASPGNDINGDLVTLYRVVQNHLEEFVRQFKWALSSRQVFEWQKMTGPETLTDIQRAARFFYLQHHAFASKVTGQIFGSATTSPAINLLRIEENLSTAWQRLSGNYFGVSKAGIDAVKDRFYSLAQSIIGPTQG